MAAPFDPGKVNSSASFDGWSLMKRPVTVDEQVLSAAEHGGNWRIHSAALGGAGAKAFELTDVGRWDTIAVMFMGQNAANEDATFDLYAYHENGPAFLVIDGETVTLGAQVSNDQGDVNMPGFLTHSSMSQPVLDAFLDETSTSWFVADTITEVADSYAMASVIEPTDLHALLILDLTVLQPKYLSFNIQIGTAAAMGAIYYPLKYRSGGRAITGIGG